MINDVIVDSLVQKCMITRVVKDWTNLKKIKPFLAAWMSIVVKIVILHELASKFNIKLNIILHYYSRSSFIDGKKKTHDESKSYIWIISFPWKRFKEVFLSHFFPVSSPDFLKNPKTMDQRISFKCSCQFLW